MTFNVIGGFLGCVRTVREIGSFMIEKRKKICDYMGTVRYRSLLVFSIIILLSITFSPLKLINALSGYAKDLPASYGKGCQVCHVRASGGGPRNNFGSDYSEHDHNIEAISKFDSDDDGYNNEEELKAGTLPGDPDSSPARAKGIPGFPLVSVMVGVLVGTLLLGLRRN